MSLQVRRQAEFPLEALGTRRTTEQLRGRVYVFVTPQVGAIIEGTAARIALEGPGTGVYTHVVGHVRPGAKADTTDLTRKWLRVAVHVALQPASDVKRTAAYGAPKLV